MTFISKVKYRKLRLSKRIRPTQGKVRKAVFNILGDISGLSFLDLFAGSGSVGIEALIMGVKKLVFVENNRQVLRLLKKNLSNIQEIGLTALIVLPLDVAEAIGRFHERGELFDIVFLDPPYYNDMVKKTLQTLDACDILTPSGFVLAEHYKRGILPENLENLMFLKQYRYGDTMLSVYKHKNKN